MIKNTHINISILTLLVLIFSSCRKGDQNKFGEAPYTGGRDIHINQLEYDTISIDGSTTSLVGKWAVMNHTLLWGDYLYGTLDFYTPSFNFIKRKLGQGKGPGEIPIKKWAEFCVDKDLFILGSSYNYIVLDKELDFIKQSRFDFISEGVDFQTLANSPKADYEGIYELDYPAVKAVFLDQSHILLPINSSHPKFNAYDSDYYEKANVLAVLNTEDSDIKMIPLAHSPIYQKYNSIPQFSNVLFDKYKDNIVVGYEADSLLYISDAEGNLLEKFGNDGRGISRDYPEVKDYRNYTRDYEQRSDYGYFTYVYYNKDTGILFRGYQKGQSDRDFDGLQIYSGKKLIGDVDVPVGMRVFGFIAPYFYAQLPNDSDSETLFVARFKLEELAI